jgi:hydroxymethylbilane synthase
MIRIGTRKSALALWQANEVKNQLESFGHSCKLVLIESNGDQNLTQPLYAMGIQGIFTKSLDTALLNSTIDIAVHSLKDVPTKLPKGIGLNAMLPRGNANDLVVYGPKFKGWEAQTKIGSGSLRRKAQWLGKYPHHTLENLRGNLEKRMEKLKNSDWSGAIFAQAGLERMDLLNGHYEVLDWMIPAPAQGVIGIASLENNPSLKSIVRKINCSNTALCAHIERSFLSVLEGGCTAPIGAIAKINGETLHFKGGLFSLDGTIALTVEEEINIKKVKEFGEKIAIKILREGGKRLMAQIKSEF